MSTLTISALEDPDLLTIDEDGKPPQPSRLADADALRAYYSRCVVDDRGSAVARTRVQEMKDGKPPYDPGKLHIAGQSDRANANFLLALHLLNKTAAGYNDIIFSVKDLVTIQTEFGEPSERVNNNMVLAQEITRTIRRWPSFVPNFLLLVTKFVDHGVGVAYWPCEKDFRFDVCGLSEFLFDRQVKASEEKIPVAFQRHDYLVTDLFQRKGMPGWNDKEIDRAIRMTTRNSRDSNPYEYEQIQQQIKNNDLSADTKFAHVPLIHCWVREFDGSYSFHIATKNAGSKEFLYSHPHKYKNVGEAFVMFCYGVGEGTFHSIRGLGHLIFPLIQLQNRLMCQMADAAMIAGGIVVQPESQKALDDLSIQPIGPYTVMSPGLEMKDRTPPDLTRVSYPILNDIRQTTAEYTSQFSTPSAPSGVYENRLDTENRLEGMAGNDSGSIDLFYSSLDRLYQEVVRRIIKGDKRDPLIKELFERLEKKGIEKEVIDSIDHGSTAAKRAVGAGNAAQRGLAFAKLLQLLPNLDEIGQKRLIYDFVADIVGHQNAEAYASLPEEPRLGTQAKVAELENLLLLMGNRVGVNPDEMHATHAMVHVPVLGQIIEDIETGAQDPMELLPGLRAMLEHCAQHAEALAQDPGQVGVYRQMRQVLNNIRQIVDNYERKLRSMEANGEVAPQEGGDPAAQQADMEMAAKARIAELKVAQEELKLNLAQTLGDLKVAEQQAKQQQALAINDLRGAQMAARALAFPALSYKQRQ
jgi:hypothetical protein